MPIEIDVKEQVIDLGGNNPSLAPLDIIDIDESDASEHDTYQDTDYGYFTINGLTFPHNVMEVVHRTSNTTLSTATRGAGKGHYAFRSRYPENLFTLTIPLLNNSPDYISLSADLIGDLKTFGFIELQNSYLPNIEESYGIFSVDEFRINIDADLDLAILEIDVQPVNMRIFGSMPSSYDETGPERHIGDYHTITALDEIIRVGDRPTLEERQNQSGQFELSPLRLNTGKLSKDMTEFRAFLEDSREIRKELPYNKTNYHEDDIPGDFKVEFKVPYIYPKDGNLSDSPVTFQDEDSVIEVMDTSEESLVQQGADYRVFSMTDLRSPPMIIPSEEGLHDFEGNSVLEYYQGKSQDVPDRAKVAKDYIVRYVPDSLAFDESVHSIKSITYRKGYKFARHYIGSSSLPLTQYIGPKPATLSIVSYYAAPDLNNEYNVSEDVPQFFQRLIRHIDDNNKVYPMANAFNFIKISDEGLNYIEGKYIPSESYRLASADNSNMEVFATNFIETGMDDIYDESKLKLATEPVSSNYTRSAAEVIAKYLVIAKKYLDSNKGGKKEQEYHLTLLNRLARLKDRISKESQGELATFDSFERPEYIDPAGTPPTISKGVDVDGSVGAGTTEVSGKLVIMGDSIAVGFWNTIPKEKRESGKILMLARSSWTPAQIFSTGGKETSSQGGAQSPKHIYKHTSDGSPLPSQMSMLSGNKDCTVILSCGISNNYNIKEQELANYIISLAKQVKSVHILGVATNYYVKNKYGSYDGRNGKMASRLKQVYDIVKQSASNVTLGPSSDAPDKIHPKPSSHTEATRIANQI